jgi:hypothetical protein
MTAGSDNIFPKLITAVQVTDIAAPSDGSWKIYSKPGGVYARSSNSVVGPFSASGAAANLAAASYTRTSADYTTTSTTFVDVDGTNLALTITTGARRCLVGLVGTAGMSAGTADEPMFDIAVDGTRIGAAFGLWSVRASGNLDRGNASGTVLTDALSAGSHTFKLQWRVFSTGTAILHGATADAACRFWVVEQYAA